MEYVNALSAEFEKYAGHFPEFVDICKKYGLPPGMVLLGASGFLVVLGILMQGYNIVCALLTCVYPMLQSVKTIESEDHEETNMWLCFWTVFGLFQTAELFFGFILYFIPYYSIFRILFFLYLMLPQTQGAKTLYTTVFRPTLKKYQPEIKAFIEKVTDKASELQKEGMAAGSKMAQDLGSAENMAKAAAVASSAQKAMDGMDKKDD